MAKQKLPKTFEEVQAQLTGEVEAAYQTAVDSRPATVFKGAARQAALDNICPIWKAARPIVGLLASLPFFPAKWQGIVKQFVATMDLICP